MPHIDEYKLQALDAKNLPGTAAIEKQLQANWNGRQIIDLWHQGKSAEIFTSENFHDFIRICQLKKGLCFGQVHTLIGLSAEKRDIKQLVDAFNTSQLPYSLQIAHLIEQSLDSYLQHSSVEKKELDSFTKCLSTALPELNLRKKADRKVAKQEIQDLITQKIADHKAQKTLIKKAKKILSYCKRHKVKSLQDKKLKEKMTALSKILLEKFWNENLDADDVSTMRTPAMIQAANKLHSQITSILTKPLPTTLLKIGKEHSFKPKESLKEALAYFSKALTDKKIDAITIFFTYEGMDGCHVGTLLPQLIHAYYDPNCKKIKVLYSRDNSLNLIKEYLKTGVYTFDQSSAKIRKISFIPIEVHSIANTAA
jgi:hypothetical protein